MAEVPPGWYPFDDDQQGYWNGEEWTEHRAPAVKKKKPVSQWRILLACVVVFASLGGLWTAGTFDTFLARFGLQHGDCAHNLITGAYLCGDDLEALCNSSLGSHSDAC